MSEKITFKFVRKPFDKIDYEAWEGNEILFAFHLLPAFPLSTIRWCRKKARGQV